MLGISLAQPAYGGRERPRTARGKTAAAAAGGILPLLAIEAERPSTAFRPKRQGWVFSARVKAVAAVGGKFAPFLCEFRLDTAPKTLHLVVGASAEHKFEKFPIDNERIFVYYKH